MYIQHYSNHANTLHESISNAAQSMSLDGSPYNFTLSYKKDNLLHDELEEYFKLTPEDFDMCKPLKQWLGQQAQFPNFYCLAQDLFLVNLFPCLSVVAIEWIFSGGQDTIS